MWPWSVEQQQRCSQLLLLSVMAQMEDYIEPGSVGMPRALWYPQVVLTAALSCPASAHPCAPIAVCAGWLWAWQEAQIPDPETLDKAHCPRATPQHGETSICLIPLSACKSKPQAVPLLHPWGCSYHRDLNELLPWKSPGAGDKWGRIWLHAPHRVPGAGSGSGGTCATKQLHETTCKGWFWPLWGEERDPSVKFKPTPCVLGFIL